MTYKFNKKYFDNIIRTINNDTKLYKDRTENFYAVWYNGRKLNYKKLFNGTPNEVLMDHTQFRLWLKQEPKRKITFIHNHPLERDETIADILLPSQSDYDFTNSLIMYQYTEGFNLAEHLIVIGEHPNVYYAILQDNAFSI